MAAATRKPPNARTPRSKAYTEGLKIRQRWLGKAYVDKAFRWDYSGRGRTYDYEGFNRFGAHATRRCTRDAEAVHGSMAEAVVSRPWHASGRSPAPCCCSRA